MKTETLSIDLLRLDGDTQSRIEVNAETVDDYADLIKAAGKEWPFEPLTVFHDGSHYFVADGFHRTMAAINSKRSSIPCVVKRGTCRDARIYGMTANDKHGLRMSRDDRRINVVWLLETYPELKQGEVAEKAGVSIRTVSAVVAERKPKPTTQVAYLESKTQGKSSVSDAKPASRTPREPGDEQEDDVPFDVPDQPKPEPGQASIMLDTIGNQIPKNLRQASELAIQLQATGRELDKYRKLAKSYAEQPGGEWLNLQTIDDEVRALKNSFQGAQYHTVCQKCNGKGCPRCNQFGYLPEHRKNIL